MKPVGRLGKELRTWSTTLNYAVRVEMSFIIIRDEIQMSPETTPPLSAIGLVLAFKGGREAMFQAPHEGSQVSFETLRQQPHCSTQESKCRSLRGEHGNLAACVPMFLLAHTLGASHCPRALSLHLVVLGLPRSPPVKLVPNPAWPQQ